MPAIDLSDFRAIYFDAVGTLLYPVQSVATTYRNAALRQGIDLDDATVQHRLREAFAKQERIDRDAGWRTSEVRELDRWRTIVRETLREVARPDDCLFELWEWFREPTAWKTHPQTAEVLTELQKRDFTLGMASNFDARLAVIVAAKPELQPLAERLIISSLAGYRKPAPEFFAQVIDQAGQSADRILYVGDDLRNDYEGAIASGLRSVLLVPPNTDLPYAIHALTDLL